MKRMKNKAMIVPVIPAVMLPVMFALEKARASDFLVGLWVGTTIGLMILLLVFAVRDNRPCDRAGNSEL